MYSMIKITVNENDKTEEVIINLDNVVSIKLIKDYQDRYWLNIVTVVRGSEGIVTYRVTDEAYAIRLFEMFSDEAEDLTWTRPW